MRLLLDEMSSPAIARSLRDRGHDVVAAAERADLRGLPDHELLTAMATEQRAIVTENAAHFMPLLIDRLRAGTTSSGLVLTSGASLPRGAGTVGAFVVALERELVARPGPNALQDQAIWLNPS